MIALQPIESNSAHPITLGIAFMKQFTYTLDYSDNTVTLAVNKYALEGSSIYPVPPEPPEPVDPVDPVDPDERRKEIDDEVMQGLVLGIIFCVVIFIVVLIIVWICRCKRAQEMRKLSESLDNTRDELQNKYGRRTTEQKQNIV